MGSIRYCVTILGFEVSKRDLRHLLVETPPVYDPNCEDDILEEGKIQWSNGQERFDFFTDLLPDVQNLEWGLYDSELYRSESEGYLYYPLDEDWFKGSVVIGIYLSSYEGDADESVSWPHLLSLYGDLHDLEDKLKGLGVHTGAIKLVNGLITEY
jgi:hypothetical protein